jgi:LuxR family maltose regulon positive regulatory protein
MTGSIDENSGEIPLLSTKLYAPRWRPGLVSRPRLVARMNRGAERGLILVSAPAGFGKTTMLAEWLSARPGSERPAAWVSLDQSDNDPVRFWTYAIAALQSVWPGIGASTGALLRSHPTPPPEATLTPLINEIASSGGDTVLILDDYHVIDARAVHEAVAFLIDHLPPSLRLVIASRSDPPLPLSRLRARGEVVELRAADLRFTRDEATGFLNDAMGLCLSDADVFALEGRTEGWIAGMQLAALSLQGHGDASAFVQSFAGDHRYIVDYLVDEVLRRQPDPTRDFLLQTAVLDRLHGPLCDAVTGRDGGAARLEALERGNFFVVPLDDRRQWYRYHHLFADVLRVHLASERPDEVDALHRRASAWFERNGSLAEAIRHALAAGDADHAADLVERTSPAMRRNRQESTLLGWLRALPDELLRNRPVLSNLYAGVLMQTGELEGVEARLRDAERWLTTADDANGSNSVPAGPVVVDEAEFRRLPGLICVHRAGFALAQGKIDEAVHHARRSLDLIVDDDDLGRGAAAAILGLASWTTGALETAHQSFAQGMASIRRAGFISDAVGGVIALADIRIAQGRLGDAVDTYEQALRLAAEHGNPLLRGTADMHVGLSEILCERGDPAAAARELAQADQLGEQARFPQYPHRWRVAMANIRWAEGAYDDALALLDEAERRYMSDLFPNVRPIAALKTRLWIAQGRLVDAAGWARRAGLSPEDPLSYLREYEHITLAMLLIARSRQERTGPALDQAMQLLERLIDAAEAGERTNSVIAILIQQALAYEAQGDIAGALAPLERSLVLAEPEGYLRTFTSEGAPMIRLLTEAQAHGRMPGYAGRLLGSAPGIPEDHRPTPLVTNLKHTLPEPLSEREIEVLQLIAAGCSNREIGEHLFLALDTVKGHNRRIFGKLGVQRRTEAMARARELGLL